MRIFSFTKILSIVALGAIAAFHSSNAVSKVGRNEQYDLNVKGGVSRSDVISHPGASYIAVHFSSFHIPSGEHVVVRNPENTVSYTYSGLGRAQLGKSGGFYASYIPGISAIVEYHSSGAKSSSDFGYAIDKFARGYPELSYESICGVDNTLPAKCYKEGNLSAALPHAYERSQAVARLLIGGSSLCTGWLVGSEGHLLTNEHCITNPEDVKQIDFEFQAESSNCNDKCAMQLGCKGKVVATSAEFIANDPDHDWALVKLNVSLAPFGYLQLRDSGPKLGEQIYIPQHPRGWAKRIVSVVDDDLPATVNNLTANTPCGTNQVGYLADTQGGSSGSPVISAEDNYVIALHHCGGCENTAVNIINVINDFTSKNITIKDLLAPSETPSPSETPVPSPSETPVPSPSETPVPSPSETPVPSPSETPAPPPTPVLPTTPHRFCNFFERKWTCNAWFWCKWNGNTSKCDGRFN